MQRDWLLAFISNRQYFYATFLGWVDHWVDQMSRLKEEKLFIRTSAEIKPLLRMAAERERRSVALMIEVLIAQHGRAGNSPASNEYAGGA